MGNDLLKGLNEEQIKAVQQIEGPVLIIAGAGSGKTRCLTHRIAYLICEKKIAPEQILAITFTNKAAGEMKGRMADIMGEKRVFLPWMGTFHSICVKILRQDGYLLGFNRNFSIYDEDDSVSTIKTVMKEAGIDTKQYAPQAVKSFISGAKNELMDPEEYQKYAQGHFQEIVLRVYKIYQTKLKSAQAMDFDDLIMLAVRLLENNPQVLEKYQKIFKYILIDEYQDTNQAQYILTKLLAKKYRNICAVGDDFQAIYGWRGANFRNLLNFEKDYPEAKVFKLERNYRSTQTILEVAQKVIEKNRHRTEKILWTKNDKGVPVTVFEARNGEDEAEFVGMEIEGLNKAGISLNEFAVLYRTNAQSRIMEETFLKFRIPYRLIGALRFYERKEIKDTIGYLRLLVNPDDEAAEKRVINTPPRGIGEKTIEQSKQGKENPKITNFWKMIDNFRIASKNLSVDKLIDVIMLKTGYKDYIQDGTPEGETRWENIEELKNVASVAENLETFLEEVSLVSDVDNLDIDAGAVTLMTLHCAKGLEFPVVFIIGMEEGIFPHSRSLMDAEELEEERRLCYVGMTRAKKRLYLSHAFTRIVYGGIQANTRSRFLDDIPEELIDKIN